jgi:hypothetical protein
MAREREKFLCKKLLWFSVVIFRFFFLHKYTRLIKNRRKNLN